MDKKTFYVKPPIFSIICDLHGQARRTGRSGRPGPTGHKLSPIRPDSPECLARPCQVSRAIL